MIKARIKFVKERKKKAVIIEVLTGRLKTGGNFSFLKTLISAQGESNVLFSKLLPKKAAYSTVYVRVVTPEEKKKRRRKKKLLETTHRDDAIEKLNEIRKQKVKIETFLPVPKTEKEDFDCICGMHYTNKKALNKHRRRCSVVETTTIAFRVRNALRKPFNESETLTEEKENRAIRREQKRKKRTRRAK